MPPDSIGQDVFFGEFLLPFRQMLLDKRNEFWIASAVRFSLGECIALRFAFDQHPIRGDDAARPLRPDWQCTRTGTPRWLASTMALIACG